MIKIEFTEKEKSALHYERFHHPHPRVQQKMEAVWLKSQELPHNEICRLTCISKPTLCQYLKCYQEGGIEKLKTINYYQPESDLAAHQTTLEAFFLDHPPASIKEAMGKIQELTGISRSETQVRRFIKSFGMKCRKIGMIPAKADPEKQEQFKREKLEPVLDEAKDALQNNMSNLSRHYCVIPFTMKRISFDR